MVEMFYENTQKVKQDINGNQKEKRKIFDDGCNSSNGSLESGVDNPMLASQEIQGHATPATIHGNSVVFETVKGKEEEEPKTDQLQQSPQQKLQFVFFTTSVKPRLRWTTKLHARFVDAINKLGGPQKATPKILRDAMGLEGLGLHQVKSHLQKYRMGKLTVRDWPEIPKIRYQFFLAELKKREKLKASTMISKTTQKEQKIEIAMKQGPSYGTSTCKEPSQANGRGKYKCKKVKKTYKPEKESQAQGALYMKLKDAEYQKNSNDLIQVAQKKLADQFKNVGVDANAGVMSRQDLPGAKTTVITTSFHSFPEKTLPKYDTLDKIKECIGFQKQISSSTTCQPQNDAYSATRYFITSQGYSCKAYNAADAINVHAGLQELTPSILSQYEAYISLPQSVGFDFHPQSAAHEFQQRNISYSASNSFPTSTGNHSENTEYLQNFQAPSASYTFQSQNTFNDYQTHKAYYPFQLQKMSYNYQPQSLAYINQLQNAASSATNNLPSNVNYSGTAYLDDLTAALAIIGGTNIGTLLNDPVDTYMVRDNPEPNAKDNGNKDPTM